MEATETKKPSHQEYVRMSIDAGIPPLELQFFPVLDCSDGEPIAYRTKTLIHSVMLGDLTEDDYLYVSDVRECGAELLRHNLQHAIAALGRFAAAEKEVKYVSVHCPVRFAENVDLYTLVKEVLEKNPSIDPQKLCLEFPAALMTEDTERACILMNDMKLLKVRTALLGCGTETFPTFKLLNVTPDIVILDPTITAYAADRGKPQLLSSLVSYIHSMGIESVAEGEPELRNAVRRTDCIGFLEKGAASISLDEALIGKEERE